MRDLKDYQQQYENQPYERFLIYFRKRKIAEILSNYKHDTLLEIGCGLDPIFTTVNSYKNLFVVEPSELFYNKAIAERQLSERSKDIVVINKLIEESVSELGDVNFDFVLLSSLLHEIPDPAKFLDVTRQVVSRDTVVHINVPNAKSFHRLLAVEMGLIRDEFQKSDRNMQFQQYSIFDIESLRNMVESNGFKVIDGGSFSFKPFAHWQMENMIQANLITHEMLEGFYKMEKYMPGLGSEIFVNVVKK